MEKTIIAIENAPKAIGPYSQGVKIKNPAEIFYFSGQLGIDPKTAKMTEGGIIEQTKTVLSNIFNLLAANGMTTQNVVKTLIFITDMANFSAVNAEYAAFFKENPPARSCVEVSKLPLNGLVEIEVIAVK